MDKGIDVAEYHNKGCMFTVVHVDINYKKPAKLGETIDVTTGIIDMTNATVTFGHQIFRDNILLVEANVKLACIDKDGRPRRLPDNLKEINPNLQK